MKYDVYLDSDTAFIYPRGEVDPLGYLPGGIPMKVTGSSEWQDYCFKDEDVDYKQVRVFRKESHCRASFVRDLENVANVLMQSYIEDGKENGWGELVVDSSGEVFTYRMSANWKNEPTYYCFSTRLSWTNKTTDDIHCAKFSYNQLLGMARGVYELGWQMVFDEQFKVYIKAVRNFWMRLDEV